jgi:hypothetical protein
MIPKSRPAILSASGKRFSEKTSCENNKRRPRDQGGLAMKSEPKTKLGRRDFLRALGAGAGVAVATPLATPAAADTENNDEKRKARYKADSAEVKTYYRVNNYPS